MRYTQLPYQFFKRNREKYLAQLPEGSVSIFSSNDLLPTNADGTYGFIQNSSFYYLTGIDQDDCFLVLVKGEGEWLFIKETSEIIKIWDGEKLSKAQASVLSGISQVEWLDQFWSFLTSKLAGKLEIWVHRDTTQMLSFPTFQSKAKAIFDRIQANFPSVEIRNPERIINQIRLFKEAEEIEAMKIAIDITHKGLLRAAQFIHPGCYEFEIEAEITHEFMMNRSRFHAFMPIIAAGANACVLHYVDNHQQVLDGDLVLIDFGAEYANYKADMTRVLPANGKFTDRQAEVYESVLYVLRQMTTLMVKGNTILNLRKECTHLIGQEIVKLGLASVNDVSSHPEIIQKYFPHGVSHSLGIDVHDVGDRATILDAGMVITNEPGIYIAEEGIGIRLENDILVTNSGNVDLMAHVPIEIKEIENITK